MFQLTCQFYQPTLYSHRKSDGLLNQNSLCAPSLLKLCASSSSFSSWTSLRSLVRAREEKSKSSLVRQSFLAGKLPEGWR